MTKEEQIKELTEKLLALMASPEPEQTPQVKPQPLSLTEISSISKTMDDLQHGLNVDVNIVRKIMKRVDEVYGVADNYKYTSPMFEEFERILKG